MPTGPAESAASSASISASGSPSSPVAVACGDRNTSLNGHSPSARASALPYRNHDQSAWLPMT